MSNQSLRLTYEQIAYIVEQTGIKDPKEAMVYFAKIMKEEGLKIKQMPEVVTKLMERQRRQK